jgi:hypothetical protein
MIWRTKQASVEVILSQLEKAEFYASLKIITKLAAVLEVEPQDLLRPPPKKPKAS